MEWLIVVILLLVIALLGSGYYLTRVAIYPKVFSPDVVYQGEIEKGRLQENAFQRWSKMDVRIQSPDGYELSAQYFPIEGSQKTVILSHGITMCGYQMLFYLPIFRDLHFNVLVYDLRNHGKSGGKNTTFGFYEKHDLKAVVDWAFDQLQPGGKVGTMGLSLGAGTSLQHAAIDTRLAFIIADCPYSNLYELFRFRLKEDYHLPAFPVLTIGQMFFWLATGARYQDISPSDIAARIEAPLLLIHGENDTYVPPEMGIEIYEQKTTGYRKMWLAPGSEHAVSLDDHPQEYRQVIQDFLKENDII
jgi:uncharacterized protein